MTGPSTDASRRAVRRTAVWLVLAALLVNPWTLGRDEVSAAVPDARVLWLVLGAEAVGVLLGAWLLLARPARLAPLARLARPLLVVLVALGLWGVVDALRPPDADARRHLAMLRSEEVLLARTAELGALDRALLDLGLPGGTGAPLFAARVEVSDLAPEPSAPRALPLGVTLAAWPVTAPAVVDASAWDGWRPFLRRVAWFEHAHFALVRGEFTDEAETGWEADLAFAALARGHEDQRLEAHAKVAARWTRGADDAWRLDRFVTSGFTLATSPAPFFREVLDAALPDDETRRRARRSVHEERLAAYLLGGAMERPDAGFTPMSNREHPGLAVADVDGDGWDDLYVTTRAGPNQLFLNQRDGTFREAAAERGLELGDFCTAAVFADFDADGDADVFVARTQEPSLYLRQGPDGRFTDASDTFAPGALPAMATSVSAADVDGDGRLDVYFSTYLGGLGLAYLRREGTRRLADWLDLDEQRLRHMPREQYRELMQRTAAEHDPWVDRVGAPNVLLAQRDDGRFEVVEGVLEDWRNTFQATWCDFDQDGDPDVYLANDFAPNTLWRNDGGFRFTDVTAQTRTADIGFGMGASWGDYDLDGRPDLYVTNMFSKAGRRITAATAERGERYQVAARGNSLLRQGPEARFEHVSGLEPPALLVEKAGWGWGSLFVDVDNDGRLDIHALSGNYTAPPEVASLVDT